MKAVKRERVEPTSYARQLIRGMKKTSFSGLSSLARWRNKNANVFVPFLASVKRMYGEIWLF